MKYTEIKEDLFEIDNQEYYFAHSISSDCQMDAGIALHFNKKFKLRKLLRKKSVTELAHPTCIKVEGTHVFNLITKEKYYHIPTYEDITESLKEMKAQMLKENITRLAIPKIGSGLDKKEWEKIKEIIQNVFNDTDIEILVCYL